MKNLDNSMVFNNGQPNKPLCLLTEKLYKTGTCSSSEEMQYFYEASKKKVQ
jgi:hypothetical protein